MKVWDRQLLDSQKGLGQSQTVTHGSYVAVPDVIPGQHPAMTISAAAEFLSSLHADGYVVLRGQLPPEFRSALLEAARHTRQKSWPHVRTVGKQFPPWPDAATASDVWGIQHILHPDLGEPIFGDWYASDAIIDTVKTILGVGEDELQMGG